MTSSAYRGYHEFLAGHVIAPFYDKRFADLNALRLKSVLKRKNPYLFKAKNIELAGDFVKGIVDAHLSSQEETIFGNLLEYFAIHVSATSFGGFKSTMKSVDLEFTRDDAYYIVGIKSGPNWGNSDQINKMRENFKAAKKTLRRRPDVPAKIVAVNGCIYGTERVPFKRHKDPDKSYFKYCGQEFWELISGDPELYRAIIVPIDEEAKRKDENFKKAYVAKINELTEDFMANFMTSHRIDWIKLIDFVSRKEDE
jgi:site-specific DNA-methyltransferase (cytosine-N4-specific)